MGIVYHTEPECGSLAKVTGTHFLLICHVLYQDGASGVILQCDVEGLTTICLNKIEQGFGVGDLNVLLNEQALHGFSDSTLVRHPHMMRSASVSISALPEPLHL